MEAEFIPYEHALALKELKFDEPCFGYYVGKDKEVYMSSEILSAPFQFRLESKTTFVAPTFSQAFRWFREKYNLHHSISILQRACRYHFEIRTIEYESDLKPFGDNKIIYEDGPRKKYEDIELECLKKLIEVVKNK